MKIDFQKENFVISSDKNCLDFNIIHSVLSNAYWSKGISMAKIKKSIENSFCLGLYDGQKQIGFSKVITDYSRFAYLLDVFVIDDYKGKGLGKWLVESTMNHPKLTGIKKWFLATSDAHGLYEKYGFKPIAQPEKLMEYINPAYKIEE